MTPGQLLRDRLDAWSANAMFSIDLGTKVEWVSLWRAATQNLSTDPVAHGEKRRLHEAQPES